MQISLPRTVFAAEKVPKGDDRIEFVAEFRRQIWQMEQGEEIDRILFMIRDGLEALEIPFWSCGVHLIDASDDPPTVWQHALTKPGAWSLVKGGGAEVILQFWYGQAIVYRPDVEREDPYRDKAWIEQTNSPVRSVIDIPFSHGTFAINSTLANPFSAEDIKLFERISQVLSEGFHRLADLDKLSELSANLAHTRHLVDENRLLLDTFQRIGRSILSSLDLDLVLDQLAEHILKNGIFRSLMVALVNPRTNHIETWRSLVMGEKGDLVSQFTLAEQTKMNQPIDSSDILADVVRKGRFEVVEGWDRARYNAELGTPEEHRDKVAYFMPIKKGDQVLGVVATASRLVEKKKKLEHIKMMAPLLDQLAIAIDHARLYQERLEQQQELECRVDERTAELRQLNRTLEAEVAERSKAEAQLLEYQEQLRALTAELSLTEERERRRFADTLHDHIGQNLLYCTMRLGAFKKQDSLTERTEVVDEVRQLLQQAVDTTRHLTFELSPPVLYELGLEAGVHWLADEFKKRYGIRIEIVSDGRASNLSEEVASLLFQVVRELLTNVAKHAGVDSAQVTVGAEGSGLGVWVRDRGRGFDSAESQSEAGFGLFRVRERIERIGGLLQVKSVAGRGTELFAWVPLDEGKSILVNKEILDESAD